jgi:uncharacterized protein
MDITPLIPEGVQIVESYGERRFRISGEVYQGSVLVLPERTLAWPVEDIAALSLDSLRPLWQDEAAPELLLLGCGRRAELLPSALRQEIRAKGIIVEVMDSGAAARTYNVLIGEGRRVAAALIAVD